MQTTYSACQPASQPTDGRRFVQCILTQNPMLTFAYIKLCTCTCDKFSDSKILHAARISSSASPIPSSSLAVHPSSSWAINPTGVLPISNETLFVVVHSLRKTGHDNTHDQNLHLPLNWSRQLIFKTRDPLFTAWVDIPFFICTFTYTRRCDFYDAEATISQQREQGTI